MLALLTARLQARSSTHLRSLDESFATVRRNLEEVSATNGKGVDARRSHLGLLEKSNADAVVVLERQTKSVEDVALHQREVSRLPTHFPLELTSPSCRLSDRLFSPFSRPWRRTEAPFMPLLNLRAESLSKLSHA